MSLIAAAKDWTYALSRELARFVATLAFGIRVYGREHFPPSGGALVCANHQSYYDPVLVGLACDRKLNYLARANLFEQPLFRALIEWYDAIPIERDGLGLAGIKETLRRLRRGEQVLIFPEGTRTSDGALQPIKPGFSALARRGQVPLVPVAIDGAFDAWPRTQKLPGRATIHIHVGPPIAPEECAELSDESLVAELQARIAACLDAARATRAAACGNGLPGPLRP